MKFFFILINIFLSFTAICQLPAKELNPQEKKFFQTLVSACEYLKKHNTIPLTFHESPNYSKDELFYDEVIDRYFDKNKTNQLLMKDTSVFGIEGKMDMMRHILNGADYFLDIIPSDSIFVRQFNSNEVPNTLEIYLIVNTKEVPILLCRFDPLTNLLVSLSGGATPGTEEFISYLTRQKNYYEFPYPYKKN